MGRIAMRPGTKRAISMMRMLMLGLALAFATAASADLYRWVDENGRVRYTDRPPPAGVKARTITTPSGSPKAAPPASAGGAPKDEGKEANKGPLTPTQQEQAFQKRRLEAQKAQEKAAKEAKEQQIKETNCARAQDALRTYESGQRVARTNAQGERYYLDDQARSREADAARQAVRDWCGG